MASNRPPLTPVASSSGVTGHKKQYHQEWRWPKYQHTILNEIFSIIASDGQTFLFSTGPFKNNSMVRFFSIDGPPGEGVAVLLPGGCDHPKSAGDYLVMKHSESGMGGNSKKLATLVFDSDQKKIFA